jgi:glycosyltransferase involved in cell wall biosynthesis
MIRRKLRVLLDLSMASRGYCGIAQDVRLLYKTLALCPDVEVTGLVYRPQKFVSGHRFRRTSESRSDRVANQAEFLWKLSESGITWPGFRPARLLKQLQVVGSTFAARTASLDPLDTDKFWPTLWRLLFSQTLPPEDIPLVQQGRFLLSDLSDGMIFARTFTRRAPIRLDTTGFDYLIVQGPRAFRTSPGTRQIVRYHDMIPVLEPDTMGNPLVIHWHNRAIRENRSAYFVCNSEPTRDDLTRIHPALADRSTTIPYMLSDVYSAEPNRALLRSIVQTRRSPASGPGPARPLPADLRYIMTVSTLEPRKNFLGLIQAFNQLQASRSQGSKLKLVIVGSPGWRYQPILQAMRPQVDRGEIVHLERVKSEELRVLYTHAEAFVFPSTAEGFGFPPLEAMSCDVPVIASDLPAHRWVLGDAALYCSPIDPASIAAAIERLVASDEGPSLRNTLIARGRERVARFTLQRCGSQWQELLERLQVAPADASIPFPSRLRESAEWTRSASLARVQGAVE